MSKMRLHYRICSDGRWQKSESCRDVTTSRSSKSTALQMSALNSIGLCVCVLAAGAADANTAARAAVHVQNVLRRDYNLLTD